MVKYKNWTSFHERVRDMQNTEDIKKKRHIAKNFDENQQCVQIVG